MVYIKCRSKVEMIRKLKRIPQPKAIIFVGMHREREATDMLPETVVDGKQLHRHFPNVAFVQVPERYTTTAVYSRLPHLLQGFLEHLADGRQKLEKFDPQQVKDAAKILLVRYRLHTRSENLPQPPKKLEEIESAVAHYFQDRALPDEYRIAHHARAACPQAKIITVHGFTTREHGINSSSVQSIKYPEQVKAAIKASEVPLKFNPLTHDGRFDAVVELKIPAKHVGYPDVETQPSKQLLDASAYRGYYYTAVLNRDHPQVKRLFTRHAKHLKGFLSQFLRHL